MELAKWESPAPKDLWDAFENFRGEMGKSLDLWSLPDVAGIFDRTTAPAVDVMETGEEYLVFADLPGVERKELEVNVTGSLLTIKGKKSGEGGSDRRKVFRKETWAGEFSRTLDLPSDIDADKVLAELKDGVLSLRIPKKEESRTRTISVKVGS
jgi:HSP20 family protein